PMFSCRSSASSSQTGVNANGWNTSRTFERPQKSESLTRSPRVTSRSNSGALSPVLTVIARLLAAARRAIVPAPAQGLREVLELESGVVVVGVDVALSVTPILRRLPVPGRPEHRRRSRVSPLADVLARLPDRDCRRVRLGRTRELDSRLRWAELGLRKPDELQCLGRGDSHAQRARVCVPDVLRGENHHAPGDEAWILARLQHRCQVVDGCVRVAAAQGLDEGGREVVVLIALAVVEKRSLACGVEDVLLAYLGVLRAGRREGELQDLERAAGVATRSVRDQADDPVRDSGLERGPTPPDDLSQLLLVEREQLDDGAPGEKRRVDLEVRVLGGRADQRHEAVLDRVQDRVLLAFVEAVDLVDEEDRPHAVSAETLRRSGDDRPHVVDPSGDGGELLERRTGPLRHDPRDRRLPRPRRPEKDHRGWAVLLDREPERRALRQDVLLPHELTERPGPEAHREGCIFVLHLPCRLRKEVSHTRSMLRLWNLTRPPRTTRSRFSQATPPPTTSAISTRTSSWRSRRLQTNGCTGTSSSSRSRTRRPSSGSSWPGPTRTRPRA